MTLVVLDDADPPLIVTREAEGVARREDVLRDLLFAHPEMLPVHEIDPSFGRLVAVAKELVIPDVGRIDALLVDEHGRLVIVEAKLWRNPQARREVIGQILDYARELARFSYDDLQRQVSIATGRAGNVLFELVRAAGIAIDEARFVDQVSRNLEHGRFLLLIVGDGITEGTQRIGEFLDRHAGLAFDFGMVEMAQYRFTDPTSGAERAIIQPRLIAKTVVVERTVIRNEAAGVVVAAIEEHAAAPGARRSGGTSPLTSAAQTEWRDFVERFAGRVRFDDPGQEPPRHGGLNWMRVPLPGPSGLTLWRSKSEGVVGGFVGYRGSEGFAVYDGLAEQRDAIDKELTEAGLPAPVWQRGDAEASITVSWPSPAPWSAEEDERQLALLDRTANAFVNKPATTPAPALAVSVRTGLPRPLRNRVTPFGEIVVHPARGTLMGNRGCLHDAQGRIVRTSDRDAWISCVPTWPGVDRPLMTPGAYTELFFLDEATALAAGHRPCGQCRPEQLKAFKQAWRDAYGLGHLPRVAEIDCSLRRRAPEIAEDALPDGAIVEVGGQPLLRWRERWLPWRFTGYGEPVPVDPASARLISSGPMIRVLASGYVPAVHPTAETNTA